MTRRRRLLWVGMANTIWMKLCRDQCLLSCCCCSACFTAAVWTLCLSFSMMSWQKLSPTPTYGGAAKMRPRGIQTCNTFQECLLLWSLCVAHINVSCSVTFATAGWLWLKDYLTKGENVGTNMRLLYTDMIWKPWGKRPVSNGSTCGKRLEERSRTCFDLQM